MYTQTIRSLFALDVLHPCQLLPHGISSHVFGFISILCEQSSCSHSASLNSFWLILFASHNAPMFIVISVVIFHLEYTVLLAYAFWANPFQCSALICCLYSCTKGQLRSSLTYPAFAVLIVYAAVLYVTSVALCATFRWYVTPSSVGASSKHRYASCFSGRCFGKLWPRDMEQATHPLYPHVHCPAWQQLYLNAPSTKGQRNHAEFAT